MSVYSSKHFLIGAGLILTMLACQTLMPSSSSPVAPAVSSVPESSSTPLFTDDFSNPNSGWEPEKTSDDTIEYADGSLKIKDWSSEWFTWSNLGNTSYKDIHLEVTVKNESREEGYSFGLLCNQQGKDPAFYYLLISGYGDYVIGKSISEANIQNLTSPNDGEWKISNSIAKDASSYRIGADCGHGTLTLYVDGNKIDSVTDSTYSEGRVGLVLWSGETSAGPVTYDDFVITSLK